MAQGCNQEVVAMKKVACVGILVADVMVEPVKRLPDKGGLLPVNSITMHNGGNAMTAAINLKKRGIESYMVGMVGDDMFGEFLKSKLQTAGVNVDGLKTEPKTQTSASVVVIDESGERSFLHCKGANAELTVDDINMGAIDPCEMVFVTGSFLMDSFDGVGTMQFLKQCKEMGKTTFLDVCWDASGRWGELLDMAMPYIDYFMPSIDEAVLIAGKEDPDEIAQVFMDKGVKNVVIKLGGKGSYLRKEGEAKGKIFPPFYVENPVDTTGAGDSFCSGFLAAYAAGQEPEDCMVFANATGAQCVTAMGATTGIKGFEETMEWIRTYKKA